MSTHPRRLASLGLLALAATACGGPVTPPIASSSQRLSAEAARVAVLSAATKARAQSVHVAGNVDASMTATGDFAQLNGQTTAVGISMDVASPTSLSGQMTIGVGGMVITEQLVAVNGAVYVSINSGKWRTLAIDLNSDSTTSSLNAGLEYLESVGTVTDQGPATVDGVSVESYHATLDGQKMGAVVASRLSRLGGSSQTTQAIKNLEAAMSFQGGSLDAAIDGSGRLVHVSGTVDGSIDFSKVVPGKVGVVTYHETIDIAYSDYGSPVTVTPPPGA